MIGWRNQETWTVRVWLTADMEVQRNAEAAADKGPGYLREFTAQLLRGAVQPGTTQGKFAMEVVDNYLQSVDFAEIAETLTGWTVDA